MRQSKMTILFWPLNVKRGSIAPENIQLKREILLSHPNIGCLRGCCLGQIIIFKSSFRSHITSVE